MNKMEHSDLYAFHNNVLKELLLQYDITDNDIEGSGVNGRVTKIDRIRSITHTIEECKPVNLTVWVWQYYDDRFHNYDSYNIEVIEEGYQKYLISPCLCYVLEIHSGQYHYEIDFRLMTEKNIQHKNNHKKLGEFRSLCVWLNIIVYYKNVFSFII
jgi:hypothetical protein